MRIVIAMMVLTAAVNGWADARLYQWMEPDTGTTQLSGMPPAWYRGTVPGPRVQVYENAELIDDTAIVVPAAQRRALREAAFGSAGADLVSTLQDTEKSALRAAMTKAEEHGIDVSTVAQDFAEENAALPEAPVAAPEQVDDKAAALKDFLDAWDQSRLEQARTLLRSMPEQAAPPAQ